MTDVNSDTYRMSRSVAEARRMTIMPVLQAHQVMERAARGPLQEMVTSWVKAQETAIAPLLQAQETIEAAAGARLQGMVRTLVMQRWEIRPLLDTQRMAEITQGVLESETTGSGESTTDGGPANAAVALPGNAPLFPGLANPWQQVRNWELQVWVGFFLTVATILLAVAQLRGSGGITSQEVEQIIRSVQESAWTSSTTSAPTTAPPSTTTCSTTSAPTAPPPST